MKKAMKLLSLILALGILLSAMGCGAKDPEPEAPKTEVKEEVVKEEAKEDVNASMHSIWSADAPEVAATGDPIVIGGFGALTGSSSAGGNAVFRGSEMAIEWINTHGGINGRPLEMVFYDDATTPEGGVKAVTRLMDEDEVPVILGGHISPDVLAAMDYTEAEGIPMVGLGTGLSWTRVGAEYTFRGTFSGYSVYPTLLEVLQEMEEDNIAFFFAENDFGQAAEKYFIQEGAFADAGINVVETVPYPKAETDYTGHIAKALAKNPEAIVIICAANTEYSLFVKQLRQQGFKGLVYGPENVGSHAVIETAGELADGSIFACAIQANVNPENYPDNPQAAYVVATYGETYGEQIPGESIFRGWDGIMVIAQALTDAGDPEDPQAITDALWAMKNFYGCQGTFDYSSGDGEGLQTVNAYMIKDQNHLPFDRETALGMKG